MTKKLFPVLILLGGFLSPLQAQDDSGDAGQAGEFLRRGIGARAVGLGRAFTAIANDASAMHWNPAGMSYLSQNGVAVMAMRTPLREGASFNYVGGAIPFRLFFVGKAETSPLERILEDINVGLAASWIDYGSIELYNSDARRLGDQSDNSSGQRAIYASFSWPLNGLFSRVSTERGVFSWAKPIRGDLNFGFTAKFIGQDLFGADGSATSWDLGFIYTHHSGLLNLGFTYRDFNSPHISFGKNVLEDEIPATGVLGVAFRPPWLTGLMVTFDYGIIKVRERDVSFGLEYDLAALDANIPIKLRLGANSHYENFTFGINFSPEILVGQDLIPYVDWTYANEKGKFDAVGARYSLSVDFNPFSARYWYLRGMSRFPDPISKSDFENALQARNNKNVSYRYEASLRVGDIDFLYGIENQNENDRLSFAQVKELYDEKMKEGLRADENKKKLVDSEAYFNSFLYYIQSLILTADFESAQKLLKSKGTNWGKKSPFNESVQNDKMEHLELINATYKLEHLVSLQLRRLEANGRIDSVREKINSAIDTLLARFEADTTFHIKNSRSGSFLLGKVKLKSRRFSSAIANFADALNADDLKYDGIFIPYFRDDSALDDIYLNIGTCHKQEGEPRKALDAWLTGLIHAPYSDSVNKISKQISMLDVSQLQETRR